MTNGWHRGGATAIDRPGEANGRWPRGASHIRDLITSLECCHHKAERHIQLIIEAIGRGETDCGPGRRTRVVPHPAERTWQDAVNVLHAWLEGDTARVSQIDIGGIPAGELLQALGVVTPLKDWQVRRVIDRIASFLNPAEPYQNLRRPDFLQEQEDAAYLACLLRTRRTFIADGGESEGSGLSLAAAIDLLMPCNWNFPRNLRIVLRAIGGKLCSSEPFAACGRNITLAPLRQRMGATLNSLQRFCGSPAADPVDGQVLRTLGQPTPIKVRLAALLARTIQAQLRL